MVALEAFAFTKPEGGAAEAKAQSQSSLVQLLRWVATCLLEGLERLMLLRGCGRGELLEAETFEERFDLREKIGEGSFGKVFACSPRSSVQEYDSALCVKVVATKGRHAAREAKLPCDEKQELLRLLDSLRHPHIVRYHLFLETDETLYIIMSRCLGPDLVDHMEANGNALLISSVRDLARQMLHAIAAVHDHGLMHRDAKPENFRFKDPSATTLQLLDFGAAKPSDERPKAHTVTGTLLYAAPEVFSGDYCRSCDLWSCGVILFLLVSGQLPFQTSDVKILRSMHRDPVLTGDCLFRGERWHMAPDNAKSLVRGLLMVDAPSRFSAASACAHKWFSSSDSDELEEVHARLAAESGGVSTLRRCGSSRIALADLNRSYFVWNLAECDDDDDSPVIQEIRHEAEEPVSADQDER